MKISINVLKCFCEFYGLLPNLYVIPFLIRVQGNTRHYECRRKSRKLSGSKDTSFIIASTALCWALDAFQFRNPINSQLDSLGGGSVRRYLHTEQHKHRINADKHPCLEWDSIPRSQWSSGLRQFMP
jgi:hypothetical protein